MELLLVFIFILFANFLLAAAEIALAAFGETKIEELKESNDKYVPYFEKLNENQEQVYSSIHLAFTFLTVLNFHNWLFFIFGLDISSNNLNYRFIKFLLNSYIDFCYRNSSYN
jgi:hypothetical protein